jgi:hypothetical protein
MKKGWISIISGFLIGLILSFFTLEYNGWTLNFVNQDGEIEKTINELDFDLITNSFLIMVATSIVIYVFLTLIIRFRKKDTPS